MKLTRLRLFDFRNYETLDLTLDPGVNLILGENAQGKTNLLEAVGYLSTGRSFRTQKTQELIRFGASFADLNADVFSQGRDQNIRAVLFSGRRPRQLYLGGVKQKSAAALPGVLTTVLFCPEDLLVLKGGSQPRRRLLDNALCQLRPSYASALTEYNRLLDSKSRILKDYREKPDLLEPLPEYNYRLAQVGAILISHRARYLKALEQAASGYHRGRPVCRAENHLRADSGAPGAALPRRTGLRAVSDRSAQRRLRRALRRHCRQSLRLAGADAHRRDQSEAFRARASAKRYRRRAGFAAGRRALRAGRHAAGLRPQPDHLRTGFDYLLRAGACHKNRQNH